MYIFKKLLFVTCRVRIEIKHLFPCFNRKLKYGYSLNSYAPELVIIFYYFDKTRIQLFYSLSKLQLF